MDVNKLKYTSPTGFGVDVSSVRLDDLDKACLLYLQTLVHPSFIDIGCGAGGFSQAAAKMEVKVLAVDQHDFADNFASIEQISFLRGDILSVFGQQPDDSFSVAYSQRTWHYLPYEKALIALAEIKRITTGKLFISVMGIETAAGEHYASALCPVAERFSSLDPEMAKKLHIHEPVCLYSKVEFAELLNEAGWQIEKIWVSAFGNIKAICS